MTSRFQKKLTAISVIGLASGLAGLLLYALGAAGPADDVLYDVFFRHRAIEDQTDGPVVLVAADDYSLTRMVVEKNLGWPWPRDQWATVIQYVADHGARAIAVDLLFSEKSRYEEKLEDDEALADAIDASGIPVVVATLAENGLPGRFPIPTKSTRRLGAVNQQPDSVLRWFYPILAGYPSLAARAVQSVGGQVPDRPFLLHYYGPHVDSAKHKTFRYVSAADVVDAWMKDPAAVARMGNGTFQGKIVVLGAITAGTYDLKVSPLSPIYPGAEYEATAIENMLRRQQVVPASTAIEATLIFATALFCAFGAGMPGSAATKLFLGLVALAAALGMSSALFHRNDIFWLPPSAAIAAGLTAMTGVLCWSYFIEDRQRKFFLKALGQYLSPGVASELSRDRSRLRLGSERREMTVLFSDIAGFTDLSESLAPDRLGDLLNFYLGEMSKIVLEHDGTLDKYIGDAIMAFWNAPLNQPDHALLATRVAMAMNKREAEIAAEVALRGGAGMYTRIGVHTGPMAVGNLGSLDKFNYSVIGDAVNVGSRLEGANKIYGTRILLSEETASLLKGEVLVRKIDVLRLKGKATPITVFEPLAEFGSATPRQIELASRYEEALAHCRAMQWQEACKQYSSLLAAFPNDPPSTIMLKRIAHFLEIQLTDWDGVYIASEK